MSGDTGRRVVFFGMDGAFSTVPLRALAASGLRPELVVEGVESKDTRHGPTFVRLPAKPGWARRVFRRGRGRSISPTGSSHALTAIAHELGIDVIRTSDAGAVRARAAIHGVEPDALIVAGFPRLLPPSVLQLASRGGLNVHPGRLPAERGPSPLFWALKAGRTRIGFAVHVLDEGEDTGDVVANGEVDFTPGLEGQAILHQCANAAAPILLRCVRDLLAGDLVRMKQPRVGAGRCPRPTFRDGRIDPDLPAEGVYAFVSGCARAYPLFAECGGDRFFIRGAASYDPEETLPCEYALTGDRLLMRCRPGTVELELEEDGALFGDEYGEP